MSEPPNLSEPPVEVPADPPADPPAEPRQRWRLVLARGAEASELSQRDLVGAWTSAIQGAGLPVAWKDLARSRPRISFGAPLPVGMAAEGELIDVVLTERLPAWRVRQSIADWLPAGWRLVDLADVWLAGPPLAGRVVAADYRITLADGVDAAALARAASELLSAGRLERRRVKGSTTVAYDLRPLLLDVVVDAGPPLVIVTRTRFHPELGTGRPEEVVGALGDRLGLALEPASIVRTRLLLADDLA